MFFTTDGNERACWHKGKGVWIPHGWIVFTVRSVHTHRTYGPWGVRSPGGVCVCMTQMVCQSCACVYVCVCVCTCLMTVNLYYKQTSCANNQLVCTLHNQLVAHNWMEWSRNPYLLTPTCVTHFVFFIFSADGNTDFTQNTFHTLNSQIFPKYIIIHQSQISQNTFNTLNSRIDTYIHYLGCYFLSASHLIPLPFHCGEHKYRLKVVVLLALAWYAGQTLICMPGWRNKGRSANKDNHVIKGHTSCDSPQWDLVWKVSTNIKGDVLEWNTHNVNSGMRGGGSLSEHLKFPFPYSHLWSHLQRTVKSPL